MKFQKIQICYNSNAKSIRSKIKVKIPIRLPFFFFFLCVCGGGEEIGLLSITTKFGLDFYGK